MFLNTRPKGKGFFADLQANREISFCWINIQEFTILMHLDSGVQKQKAGALRETAGLK